MQCRLRAPADLTATCTAWPKSQLCHADDGVTGAEQGWNSIRQGARPVQASRAPAQHYEMLQYISTRFASSLAVHLNLMVRGRDACMCSTPSPLRPQQQARKHLDRAGGATLPRDIHVQKQGCLCKRGTWSVATLMHLSLAVSIP